MLNAVKISSKPILTLLRIPHWSKNLLLFIPLVTAHQWHDSLQIIHCLIGAICFSLIASCGYIINDFIDRHHDRLHPIKKFRPIAAKSISNHCVISTFMILFITSTLLSIQLGSSFTAIIMIYLTSSVLYSQYIKKWFLVDIITLAGLFTLRLYAGSNLIEVPLSHWLLSFSLSFFMGLAAIKRINELSFSPSNQAMSKRRRYYQSYHAKHLLTLGLATHIVSLMIFYYYTTSIEATTLYSSVIMLRLTGILIACWLSYLWISAILKKMDEDPLIFSITDFISLMLGWMILLSVVLAI